MGAATVAVPRNYCDKDYVIVPMGAVKIYQGMMVMLNASGYAVQAADTASCVFLGIADETVDNSAGSAGDLYITVYRGCFEVTSVETEAVTTVGALRYISTNQEVGAVGTTTNDILVGRIIRFVSSTRVVIDPTMR